MATSDSRKRSRAWALSWVHIVLALAVGAGMPLLWMWFAPPATPASVAVSDAGAVAAPHDPDMAPAARELAQGHAAAVPSSAVAQADAMAQVPARRIPRVRDPNGDQSPDVSDFINDGEVPSMAEVISRLHAAGVRDGLGAFNPPGTRPPVVGIAVGEDVELPPGYVRHHQFTDDGQPIEPILVFSPDHPLIVAGGQPAARPLEDLVVPPALAPPGLPIRRIVVPPVVEAGTEPRK
jgi:hypothetical protein